MVPKGSVTQSMRERKGEKRKAWLSFLLSIRHRGLVFIPGFAAMQSRSLLPLLVSHEPMQLSADAPRPLAPPFAAALAATAGASRGANALSLPAGKAGGAREQPPERDKELPGSARGLGVAGAGRKALAGVCVHSPHA